MEQSVTCPNCGNSVSTDATYCPHCGTHLAGSEGQPRRNARIAAAPEASSGRPFWRRRWVWLIGIALAIVVIAFFDSQNSPASSKSASTGESIATQPAAHATSYEIVQSEDVSHKAISAPLTSYTVAELQALPLDKKYSFKVVVPPTITQAQVKPTVEAIVKEVTSKNPDLDEASIFLYSDKQIVEGMYDVASAVWAPGGALGNVTARIASSNDRSSYRLKISVVPNLEASLKASHTPTTQFGLSDAKRREIYKAIVSAEDRGQANADKQIPIQAGATLDTINRNTDLARKLTAQYKQALQKKYGITEDVMNKIGVEGLTKNWPMPSLP